jgi:mRNA interferase MazF
VPSPRWGEINESRAELTIVVPLSKTIRSLGTHVRIEPPEGGVEVPSDIVCEHVRSVSLARFDGQRGRANGNTMDDVVKRLKVLFLLGAGR